MPDPSAAAIRDLARDILARREFGQADQNPELAWAEWLRSIIKWIGVLHVDSPILYWTVIGLLWVLVVAAIAQIVWSLRAAFRAPERPARTARTQPDPDLAGEAHQLAESGRFLEAGHRLMIATFGLLAQRSVIDLRPECSNRWIRSALRASSLAQAMALEIGALVEQTERRWFGDRQNEPEIYFRWRSLYERVLSSAE